MWITPKKVQILSLIAAGLISSFCFASLSSANSVSIVNIVNPLGTNCFSTLLNNIATGVGTLITYLGVIMLIIAGILYLISSGNPGRMETAKKALVYAIAGIAIGIAASAIVDIIKNIIGANTTNTSC